MTLIEVVITTSLMTLLIVPIYGLFYTSRQSVAEAKYHSAARLGAEHQIERIRAIGNIDEASFAGLAGQLVANPTFTVGGLPRWVNRTWSSGAGDVTNGRIRVCLDERGAAEGGSAVFTNADGSVTHDDYFATAPNDALPYPAFGMNLDSSFNYAAVPPSPTLTSLATTSGYRILPVRVEVYFGQETTPKVAIEAMIGPKTNFRRGS